MGEKKLIIQSKKTVGESTVISMRISKELLEEIDEVVAKTGNSRNEVLQLCLRFAMENLQIRVDD